MKITHQKGRGKKIHLLIDGEYKITTDIDFWSENSIENGSEIDDEQLNLLVNKINFKKAMNKCFDLLSRRDHSVRELKTKLLRTIDEVNAELAIKKMLELGYLDDEKYSKKLVNYYVNTKKFSIPHTKSEMFKKGLSSELISNALLEIEIDNVQLICDLINKKYLKKLSVEGGKQKVFLSLQRLGFSYSDINSAFYRLENDDYE